MEEDKKIEEGWVSVLMGEKAIASESEIPANEEFRAIEKTWDLAGTAYSFRNSDTDKAWSRLNGELEDKPKTVVIRKFNLLKYAAIFTGLVALASVTFLVTRNPGKITQQLAVSATEMKSVQTLAKPLELTTVMLPDGSTVKMNANSTLQYPAQFTADTRKVKLSGEAFFEVIHDAAHPFVVEVNDVEIEDLGTSFTVTAYPGKQKIEVNVTSGSVRLRETVKNTAAVLAAGWNGKYLTKNGKIEVINELTPNYLSWITRKVTFHHTPLSTVFEELENIYHVKIAYSNPAIAQIAYTANFEKFQLEDIVNIIAKTHHLTVAKEGDGFVFASK